MAASVLQAQAHLCTSIATTLCCLWLCQEATRPRERIVVVQQPVATGATAEQVMVVANNGTDLPLLAVHSSMIERM
jgi:hypothetical protein